jgi:beta-glucosidase
MEAHTMPETPAYRNPELPVEQRVEDLLARMTLEEKAGQLCQMNRGQHEEEWVRERHVGSFLFILGERAARLQKMAEQSRLGIPLIFGIDAIHGHAFWPGATVFPSQLGMSCSWDPTMVQEVGRVTAKEAAATGAHWTFSPVCCLARDLRWGRVDETFGEDPYLIGVLASALVRGYQGDDVSDPERILACAKHYAGYSETQGGRDASEADLTRRKLLSCFLVPFRMVCEAGCATYMTAYQAIDGVPCTANRWLMTEVLRQRWGFGGFVVTDYDNVGRMHWHQKTCETMEQAAALAVRAGNDMMMATPGFYDGAIQAVHGGLLQEADLDTAVRRVLRLKFAMGLFDDRRSPDLAESQRIVGCAEHRAFALEVAYRSIVLLKNDPQLLPATGDLCRIAVLGPNADDPHAQIGDWSLGTSQTAQGHHPRASIVTVLDGIRERVGDACEVVYCRGCDRRDPADEEIAEAVRIAESADLVVCVLGDDTSLNGECQDRATLDLTGAQEELLRSAHATGTPVVLVLVHGKPLSIPWAAQNVSAILAAFNPGMEGGRAVAGILFGDRNPSGKVTVSWPKHVGQQPVYYNQVPGWHIDKYADMDAEPLFAFGHGLAYTTYDYSDLRLASDELRGGETLLAEVHVRNTGQRAGTEIVQLYVNDVYCSVTTPVKELKAFAQVHLEPNEGKTVRLEVPYARLAIVTPELQEVVEPGEFEVMVGPSSRDEELLTATFRVVE